jgi:MFS family permease
MMNGLQSLPQWRTFFDPPSASILGLMNAVYPVGQIIGLVSSAFIGDRLGRRFPFYEGLCFLIVSAALQGAAQNTAMFVISRLLIGYGTGCVIQTCPILVSELSYPTHRGRFTSLYFSTYVRDNLCQSNVLWANLRPVRWCLPGCLDYVRHI